MVSILRKGLIAMIAIAMTLTMFPLIGGSAYADGEYEDDDGLIVKVSGDRLDVIVDAWNWSYNKDDNGEDDPGDGDGEPEYTLNMLGDEPSWSSEAGSVKTVFIGEGTWWIDDKSFNNFTKLETVYIPKSLGGIGYTNGEDSWGAFEGCNNISQIYYGGTKAEWNKLKGNIDGDNGSLLTADVEYEEGYKDFSDAKVSLDKNTFVWSKSKYFFKPEVKKVTLNSSVMENGVDYIWGIAYKSNVGKGKVTCYGRNEYVGEKTRTFKVIPKKTSVKKVTRPAKKKFKVTWYKRSEKMSEKRITGYQVKIAGNKKFTKEVKSFKVKGYKKTSKVIKVKKSKKRYYVKVRTYKIISGTKYWSKWSKVKSRVSK